MAESIFDGLLANPDELTITNLLCDRFGIECDKNYQFFDLIYYQRRYGENDLEAGSHLRHVKMRITHRFKKMPIEEEEIDVFQMEACTKTVEHIRESLGSREVMYICCEKYVKDIDDESGCIYMKVFYLTSKKRQGCCCCYFKKLGDLIFCHL